MSTRVRYGQTPESQAFYDHLFGCPRCIGRRSDFCPVGRQLWAAYDVPLTAAGIVAEPSLHRRRYLMSIVPEWEQEAVRAEVRRLWDIKRGEAVRDR